MTTSPTTAVLDDFTGTDATNIIRAGKSWTVYDAKAIKIYSNSARGDNGSNSPNFNYWNDGPWLDCEVRGKVAYIPNDASWWTLTARGGNASGPPSPGPGYEFCYDWNFGGAGQHRASIQYFNGSGGTPIVSVTDASIAVGDTILGICIANTLWMFRNGTLLLSCYATNFTASGYIGTDLGNAGTTPSGYVRMDDFGGGAYAGNRATFDTNFRFTGSSAPQTGNFTPAATATLVVLAVVTQGTAARAGGVPTWNGHDMAVGDPSQPRGNATNYEMGTELFYYIGANDGAQHAFSIPNTGTAKTLYCQASSYIPYAGNTFEFDQGTGTAATSGSNPSVNVTPNFDQSVIVATLGCGYTSAPTNQSGMNLNRTASGSTRSDSNQYLLCGPAAQTPIAWTVASDDRAMSIGVFKQVVAGGNSTPLAVAGSLTPAGVLVRQTKKSFAGGFTPGGIVSKSNPRSFAGSLVPAAGLTKSGWKTFTGTLTPAAGLARSTGKPLTGGITPGGALEKAAKPQLAGALAPTGTLTALRTFILSTLAGALGLAGSLIRSISTHLSGGISPSGTIGRSTGKGLLGALTPAGVIAALKTFLLSGSGSLAPAGSLAREAKKGLSGSAGLSGSVTQSISRAFTGTLGLAGSLSRSLAKTFSGVLAPSGALSALKRISIAVTGAIGFTGALLKSAGKNIAGVVTSAGSISRRAGKNLSGSLSSAGTLTKSVSRSLAGILTPAAAVAVIRTSLVVIGGAIAPVGVMAKNIIKSVAGSVAPVGSFIKRVSKTLAGSLASAGNAVVGRYFTRSLAGGISPVGEATRNIGKSLAGSIIPSGSTTKQVHKLWAGTVTLLRRFSALLVGAIYSPSPIIFCPEREYTITLQARAFVAFPKRSYTFVVNK